MKKSQNSQRGLTLIEIMIALVLGILLLGGTISMFIANKRVYREQESMSRLQENARFAIEMLMKDIRMAGYSGCSDDIGEVTNHLNGASNDDNILSFSAGVEGSEGGNNWQPSDSTDVVGDADYIGGTDAISIRFLDPVGISIDNLMPTTSAELKVTSVGNLTEGSIIGVADCDSADIMQITAVQTSSNHLQHNTGTSDPAPGNATKNLQKKYGTDAEIMSFVSRRYYLKNNPDGIPSLYRKDVGGTEAELIQGVENMQILYGVDTSNNGFANTYVDADDVAGAGGWDNVVSARIALLFRTIEENKQIDPDTNTYELLGGNGGGGATVDPGGSDYHRRRIFTTTIQLRNRSS